MSIEVECKDAPMDKCNGEEFWEGYAWPKDYDDGRFYLDNENYRRREANKTAKGDKQSPMLDVPPKCKECKYRVGTKPPIVLEAVVLPEGTFRAAAITMDATMLKHEQTHFDLAHTMAKPYEAKVNAEVSAPFFVCSTMLDLYNRDRASQAVANKFNKARHELWQKIFADIAEANETNIRLNKQFDDMSEGHGTAVRDYSVRDWNVGRQATRIRVGTP
jgi:hypothetical protein